MQYIAVKLIVHSVAQGDQYYNIVINIVSNIE